MSSTNVSPYFLLSPVTTEVCFSSWTGVKIFVSLLCLFRSPSMSLPCPAAARHCPDAYSTQGVEDPVAGVVLRRHSSGPGPRYGSTVISQHSQGGSGFPLCNPPPTFKCPNKCHTEGPKLQPVHLMGGYHNSVMVSRHFHILGCPSSMPRGGCHVVRDTTVGALLHYLYLSFFIHTCFGNAYFIVEWMKHLYGELWRSSRLSTF